MQLVAIAASLVLFICLIVCDARMDVTTEGETRIQNSLSLMLLLFFSIKTEIIFLYQAVNMFISGLKFCC